MCFHHALNGHQRLPHVGGLPFCAPLYLQDEVPNQVATGKVLLQLPAGSSHRPLIVVAVRKHLPPPG